MSLYDQYFYNKNFNQTAISASFLVPFLVEKLKIDSVLDVGCGNGLWLKQFMDLGIQDIMGVDGTYIDENIFEIPYTNFKGLDLKQPFSLSRKFDLVMSLEVAEHLPSKSANEFVDSLCNHGQIIVFSAAIPLQGGVNHVNEQWQSYWEEKFNKRGYKTIDFIRPFFWNNNDVAEYYLQNVICYYNSTDPDTLQVIDPLFKDIKFPTDIIHPRQYLIKSDPYNQSIPRFIKYLPHTLRRAIKNRINRKK